MSGYKEPIKETRSEREERLKELEKNPRLELPVKEQLNLVPHYHWEIMKIRRRKGLSHRQLAESIGESEIAMVMLEKGKLPEDSEVLIKKLEQFFQINLRKISDADVMVMRKERLIRTKPVLLDLYGNELEHIPEPAVEKGEVSDIYLETREVELEKKEIPWYKKVLGRKKNNIEEEPKEDSAEQETIEEKPRIPETSSNIPGSRYLSFRRREAIRKGEVHEDDEKPGLELKEGEDLDLEKVDVGKVKISDLKEAHKKRIDATKSEKISEQRKIEERQRLIEARKEELRAMKEKESKNIDNVLGGSELLGKNKNDDIYDNSEEENDDELV